MNQPADQNMRLKALDPSQSFIVQAPAGSGKTEVLTQRFLRLLAMVEQPERVLAITFTRKATQEMRSRIVARLTGAAQGIRAESEHERRAIELAEKVLERDQALGWQLLSNPGRLRITTIDGLCVQILSRDPELGPFWSGMRVLEDSRPLYRDAIRRMFSDIDSLAADATRDGPGGQFAQEALVNVLVHLGGDGQRLESLLVDMISRRNLWERHLQAGQHGFQSVLSSRQVVELELFELTLGRSLLAEAMVLAETLGHDLGATPGEDENHTEDLIWRSHRLCLVLSTGQKKPRKPGGITKRLFPDMDPAAGPMVERLREIYQQWFEMPGACDVIERMASWPPLEAENIKASAQGSLLDDMRSLLSLALYEFRTIASERGETDFTAISDAAVQALGEDHLPGEALLAEDQRIEHILMDEFQDTSYTQFRLLKRLISGWQSGDGRSLFLVGDPMQSIYRFREANVGFFNNVVKNRRFGDIGVEPLSLTANFRSRSELIDWFNESFAQIFPVQEAGKNGAVSYSPVHAERDNGGQVKLQAFHAGRHDQSQYRQMVRIIDQRMSEDPDGSIAVLVRSRSQIPDISAELIEQGIAFEAVAMQSLQSKPVVMDLEILMRALAHPLDRVAWIGLLRAPWCGLTIKEIHSVLGNDQQAVIFDLLRDRSYEGFLEAESATRLNRVTDVMIHARFLSTAQPLSKRVRMCWILLGGPLCCASSSDLEDAHSYLELLAEIEQKDDVDTVQAMREALSSRYATSKPAAVQLMTIHNAKGLQFDTVILPDLAKGTRTVSQPLIELQEFSMGSEEQGVLMAPYTPFYVSEVSLYRYLGKIDQERARFEDMRLLYVACTRARDALYLLAGVKMTKSGKPSMPANSFLKLMGDAFMPALELTDSTPQEANKAEKAEESVAAARYNFQRLSTGLPTLELNSSDDPQQSLTPVSLPNRSAAALGTVLHDWLELVHDCPDFEWNTEQIQNSKASIRSGLRRAGAPESDLDELEMACCEILTRVLFDQGWHLTLTENKGEGIWSELELYRRDGHRLSRHIIDLLVQNREGAYEIIDYKTRSPDEASARKYDDQLNRYETLIEKLGVGSVAAKRIMILDP